MIKFRKHKTYIGIWGSIPALGYKVVFCFGWFSIGIK